ncbi:MAG: ABC transporter substrate-binding protein, partial [Deltaproteobacteria bacterium]|nr:ABC transporter substrate-binding protein [Deltaproteobacteria bacterium]
MKKTLCFLSTVVFVMAFVGFGGQAWSASSIVVGVDSGPITMDPGGSLADPNFSVMANLFDGLLQRKVDGKLYPALAERYEHPDLVTWKFYLRKGVKFQNGNPFTADDVKFTLERLKDPKCCSEFMDLGKEIASVEIIDDYTVVVKTGTPDPSFDQNLDIVFMMDKESTETRDQGDVGVKPIGTGAYRLVEWVKGSYVKMTANKDYWEGAPPIENVEIRPVTESSTRFAALVSGEVEMISGVPVELYDRLVKNPKIEVVSRPGRRVIFLALGNKPGDPWADMRVRRAMYMAINEEEIITKVMRSQASPASQLADSAMVGYAEDIQRLPYDPARARKLLEEAGYADGFDITLAGPNDRYVQDEKICEAVAKYLAKVGIRCKLDVKPKAVFFPEIVAGDKYDFYLLGWLSNTYDYRQNYTFLFYTRGQEKGYGAWNGTSWSDPALDKLFDATDGMVDKEERRAALEDLNRKVMERIGVIPLHYGLNTY